MRDAADPEVDAEFGGELRVTDSDIPRALTVTS